MTLFKLLRNWSPEEALQGRLRFDAVPASKPASTIRAPAPAIHLLQRSYCLVMRAHRSALSARCRRCQF